MNEVSGGLFIGPSDLASIGLQSGLRIFAEASMPIPGADTQDRKYNWGGGGEWEGEGREGESRTGHGM